MARLRYVRPARAGIGSLLRSMIGIAAVPLAALLIGAAPAAPPDAANAPAPGRWAIGPAGADEPGRVSLRFEYDGANSSGEVRWYSSWSSTVPLAEAGIPAERLGGAPGPVAFRIAREPGAFDCTGSAGNRSGTGQFRYVPDAGFERALDARGLGRPSYRQSLALAAQGVTLAFVDQVRRSSQHASLAELVRIVETGVTPAYVSDLASLGYGIDAVDELERLRVHGVTPAFIRAVRAAGYGDLTALQLVRLADHGIRERYIADMRAVGITTQSPDLMIRLHDHGVTPRYVGDLAGAGYRNVSSDDLIALRDHGVTAPFVERVKARGNPNPSVRDLIRLHDAGL